MAGLFPAEPSHNGSHEGNYRGRHDKEGGGHWYFSRKEIEENSPSRQDGVDLKKETYLRKSYCTFLQDLGMRLKVPQVTIATAMIFCHRFFLHQSHSKNDRRTIATVCMFLASKVEDTPRPLKDVILVSYEIIHKKDAASMQRIKQKEVYEQQKELILLGERVVLATLGFDLNLNHPYKPLVEAIKRFEVAQNALAQVAWNFVNDGLRTSLCLQFKPHHVAAGAIFLAAKFLKVKLPSDGEKVWWQEFDVTPRQLEEVSNQMLELYEQTRVPASQAGEAEGHARGCQRPPSKGPANTEHATSYSSSHGGATPEAAASPKLEPSRPVPDQSHADNHSGSARVTQALSTDRGRSGTNIITHRKGGYEINDVHHNEQQALPPPVNSEEIQNMSRFGMVKCSEEGNSGRMETKDAVDMKDKHHGRNLSQKGGIVHQSSRDATRKLDTEKIKAAFERRKARVDITRKMDPVDELERELEDVEVPDESEKIKHERKQRCSKPLNKPELENSYHLEDENEARDGGCHQAMKGSSFHADNFDTVEEVESFNDASRGYCKRKTEDSPLDKPVEVKKRNDYGLGCQKQNHHDYLEDRNGLGRLGYSERDLTRQVQNHI